MGLFQRYHVPKVDGKPSSIVDIVVTGKEERHERSKCLTVQSKLASQKDLTNEKTTSSIDNTISQNLIVGFLSCISYTNPQNLGLLHSLLHTDSCMLLFAVCRDSSL